jgi:hypothetical protein
LFYTIGTDAYDKVLAICGKTAIVNDIAKLSSVVQTSQLEAFHSTLNQFHPKMIGFSYTGTYCRYCISHKKKLMCKSAMVRILISNCNNNLGFSF